MKPLAVRSAAIGARGKAGVPWSIGPWAAGNNTSLSIANGRARGTITAGSNPRIRREVTNLQAGVAYRVQSNMYKGTTSGNIFFRVSSTANLTNGDYAQVASSADTSINTTFTAPSGGLVYIGVVGVTDAVGQYVETDETFALSKV
jgi:hypothetical protein